MRAKYLIRVTVAVVVLAGILGVGATGSSSITRARLERNLPVTFSNLYVQQARLLGHKGITVKSLQAHAMCDKQGPGAPDHGASAEWVCLMSWKDPNVSLPDGSGKFELNVHSNDCYTAGGPSKLVGPITITDVHGNDVPNPVFEFDSCFDPHSSNAPTGVIFPSALSLPSAILPPNDQGQIAPVLSCSVGREECAGEIVAKVDGRQFGTATYLLREGQNKVAHFVLPSDMRTPRTQITLIAHPRIGSASNSPVSLTVPNG